MLLSLSQSPHHLSSPSPSASANPSTPSSSIVSTTAKGTPISSNKKATVLDEDTYVSAIENIIERDYFPDIPKLRDRLDWLEAVRSGDPLQIRDAQFKIMECRQGRVSNADSQGGGLRGTGWKYGSGFVYGIFPVLRPIAQQLLRYLQREMDPKTVWCSLDKLPKTHETWDDLMNVAVQLRFNKQRDAIILMCEWILYRSSFKQDVMSYNLVIDSYRKKLRPSKAEFIYFELLEARTVPTEDTYALLIKDYCSSGLFAKADAVFIEMRKHGLCSSATVCNAYIDGLIKGRNSDKAIEIFERMKRDQCKPTTETYTMLTISLYILF